MKKKKNTGVETILELMKIIKKKKWINLLNLNDIEYIIYITHNPSLFKYFKSMTLYYNSMKDN